MSIGFSLRARDRLSLLKFPRQCVNFLIAEFTAIYMYYFFQVWLFEIVIQIKNVL